MTDYEMAYRKAQAEDVAALLRWAHAGDAVVSTLAALSHMDERTMADVQAAVSAKWAWVAAHERALNIQTMWLNQRYGEIG